MVTYRPVGVHQEKKCNNVTNGLIVLTRRPLLTSLLVRAAKGAGQQVIRGEIQIPGLILEFQKAGYVARWDGVLWIRCNFVIYRRTSAAHAANGGVFEEASSKICESSTRTNIWGLSIV